MAKHPVVRHTADQGAIRKMQWVFIAALIAWTLLAITIPLVGSYLTGSVLSLSLFSGLAPPLYLWIRWARYIFPIDHRTFELEKMRIQSRIRTKRGRDGGDNRPVAR
jgi:hypothetical protein